MPFLARLSSSRTNSPSNSPSETSIAVPGLDYFTRDVQTSSVPKERSVAGRRSPSVSPLSSPARLSSSASLPKVTRHASSPLAHSVPVRPPSPANFRRSISGMLKRSMSKTSDVELIGPSASPPRAASPSPPVAGRDRPALKLRTRTNSYNAMGGKKSEAGKTSVKTLSPDIDGTEGTFTLVSFRSARAESPLPAVPLPEVDSPGLAGPRSRTPPLVIPVRRPTSQIFNDPLASPPTTPSIKASYFQEARAARSSSHGSLNLLDSPTSTEETLQRPPSRTSKLDLPLPPTLSRPREPLSFTPPLSYRHSTGFDFMAASPFSMQDQLEAAAPIGERATFAPPQPAFLTSHGRRNSLPGSLPLPSAKASLSMPSSPTESSAGTPSVFRTTSDFQGAARGFNIRDKAKRLAAGVYAYANERTEEAARRSTSEEATSFDATVATDSEDDLSDGDTSATSHSKPDERPAWNSEAALSKRLEAQKQAQATISEVVLPSVPPLSQSIYVDFLSTQSAQAHAPATDRHVSTSSFSSESNSMLDRPRPVTRSYEALKPLAAPQKQGRSSPPLPSTRSVAPIRPSKSNDRPPAVSRHRSRDSFSSFGTLPPALTSSTSAASLPSPQTPEDAHEQWTPRTRPLSLSIGALPAPPGVEPSIWSTLSIATQHSIEERGRRYVAMLVKHAAESSGSGDATPRDRTPQLSPIDGNHSVLRDPRSRSATTG